MPSDQSSQYPIPWGELIAAPGAALDQLARGETRQVTLRGKPYATVRRLRKGEEWIGHVWSINEVKRGRDVVAALEDGAVVFGRYGTAEGLIERVA